MTGAYLSNAMWGKTMTDVPDGAVESHSITITSYLTGDGGSAYVLSTTGEANMTSYLGLLVIAQQEILRWGDDDG